MLVKLCISSTKIINIILVKECISFFHDYLAKQYDIEAIEKHQKIEKEINSPSKQILGRGILYKHEVGT